MDASTRQGRVIIAEHCRMAREQCSGQSSANAGQTDFQSSECFEQRVHWESRRARLAHRHSGPPASLFRGGWKRHGCHSGTHCARKASLEPPQSRKGSAYIVHQSTSLPGRLYGASPRNLPVYQPNLHKIIYLAIYHLPQSTW